MIMVKIMFKRVGMFITLALLAGPFCAFAQQATTNRTVTLHRDPSTSSPALQHLAKDARLTLVDAESGQRLLSRQDGRGPDWLGVLQVRHPLASTREPRSSRESCHAHCPSREHV